MANTSSRDRGMVEGVRTFRECASINVREQIVRRLSLLNSPDSLDVGVRGFWAYCRPPRTCDCSPVTGNPESAGINRHVAGEIFTRRKTYPILPSQRDGPDRVTLVDRNIPQNWGATLSNEDPESNQRREHPVAKSRACETTTRRSRH